MSKKKSQDGIKKVLNLRHCEIVIFKKYLKVDIQAVCKKYKTIKHWAYILHDKDDTDPHYHIYLHFGDSSVPIDYVAEWFHLEYINDKGEDKDGTNFIRKVQGRRSDMLLYLIHGNDSAAHKHQYSPDEVICNFTYKTEIANAKVVGDFDHYSYNEQIQYCNMLPIADRPKTHRQIEALHKLHQAVLASRTDRNIEVVFITGGTGTAKTTYAKRMLRKLKYDFCISSSSNDPFQDYMGQRAIILDDLRHDAFSLADLLKILDNNTPSTIKSRFCNKVFEGKMIVITSKVPIQYWYKDYRINNQFDDLNQLYRRITSYFEFTKSTIKIFDGLNEQGKPINCVKILENVFINKIEKIEKKKTNFANLFDEINFEILNEDESKLLNIVSDSSGGATQESLPGLKEPINKFSLDVKDNENKEDYI